MIQSPVQLENAAQGIDNVFPVPDTLGIYEENPNPVLRVSNFGVILYANRAGRTLCGELCGGNSSLAPELYRQRIAVAIESGVPRSYQENVNDTIFQLQIVPVKGHNYADIFGFTINTPQTVKTTFTQAKPSHLRNEQVLRRRTNFARIAVHELRTPLTPILAASEMLVNRLDDGVTARLAKQINAGAIELNARIGELFDLVRAEMGALILVYQPVHLGQLFDEIAASLRPGMETRGVVLFVEADESLPQINADHERLREGLLYLMDGAIKRCQSKAVVALKAINNTDSITIQVKVTCPRIPDEIRNYLSAPSSVMAIDRERFSSIGLKLTLSKILIELHGGSIQVINDAQGNVFTVKIPLDSRNTL